MSDPVQHPSHYVDHPSGVECITVAQWFNFNLGNVIKYVWRADDKGKPLEDLRKARQYLDFEIARLEALGADAERIASRVVSDDAVAVKISNELGDVAYAKISGFVAASKTLDRSDGGEP